MVNFVLVGTTHFINGTAAVLRKTDGLDKTLKLSDGFIRLARACNQGSSSNLDNLLKRVKSLRNTIQVFNIFGSLRRFTKINPDTGQLALFDNSSWRVAKSVAFLFVSLGETLDFLHEVELLNHKFSFVPTVKLVVVASALEVIESMRIIKGLVPGAGGSSEKKGMAILSIITEIFKVVFIAIKAFKLLEETSKLFVLVALATGVTSFTKFLCNEYAPSKQALASLF